MYETCLRLSQLRFDVVDFHKIGPTLHLHLALGSIIDQVLAMIEVFLESAIEANQRF